MKEINTDVLIIGSGLVGLVAAHSLSTLKYKVTLVDKKNFSNSKKNFNDTRTVAVSEGSKRFLEDLSLWNFLKNHSEPIKTIKVFDRSYKNKILFNNENKNKKLGYVIENIKFSQILKNQLLKFKKTKLLFGQSIKKIQLEEEITKAYTKNYVIKSKLIIAADGKNSEIKKMAGNNTFKKIYPDDALVLNITHEKNLNGTAYEIFFNTGPLAILPMQSKKNFCKSTIIWSNKKNYLKKLNDVSDKFFENFIEEKIGSIVGVVKKINSKQIFPLSAHINESFINKRLIYIGDAAHSIHPIAGQGWNLGVNDVRNLYKTAKSLQYDIGSDAFCSNYNNLSYNKAFQLYQITDKINAHFKNEINLYRFLSNAGFNIIENTPLLKNKITNYAMGI
tara:strand:+ start:2307 stop:3479 length:1173 start_codon:yes stop_codon:yes gene_type:complete